MTQVSIVHPCRACGRPGVPGAGAPWSARHQCQRCGALTAIEGPIRPDQPEIARPLPRHPGSPPTASVAVALASLLAAELADTGPLTVRNPSGRP